jgi:hypothetical protein
MAKGISGIPRGIGWPPNFVPSFMKLRQLCLGQATERPQRYVQSARRMPFGKNELVVGIHNPVVQRHHQVERRQIAANVTNPTFKVHPQ